MGNKNLVIILGFAGSMAFAAGTGAAGSAASGTAGSATSSSSSLGTPAGNTTATGSAGMGNPNQVGTSGATVDPNAPVGTSGRAGMTTTTSSRPTTTSGAIQTNRAPTSSTNTTTESVGNLGGPNAAGGSITTRSNETTVRSRRDNRAAAGRNADNTRINQRDRSQPAMTADQQSMDAADVNLSRRIRENLTSQERLSTYGKNVKIITNGGQVILRGPVRSAEEKRMIEEQAASVAGARNINNQLDIVTK